MLIIERAATTLSIAHRANAVDNRIKSLLPRPATASKDSIKIYTHDGYAFIKLKHLIYCRAMGNYSEIFFVENDELKSYIVSKTLKSIEAKLPSHLFARCHQSYLIQLDQIKNLTPDQSVVLRVGKSLPVSRRMKKELLARINASV